MENVNQRRSVLVKGRKDKKKNFIRKSQKKKIQTVPTKLKT